MEDKPIGFYFKRINQQIDNMKNEYLKDFDITSQQMAVIIFLKCHREENINQQTIENFLKLKKSTVSGILDRLEKKEFVVREVSKEDSRVRFIKLTPKAFDLAQGLFSKHNDFDKKVLNGFSKEETLSLMSMLNRIIDNISNKTEDL